MSDIDRDELRRLEQAWVNAGYGDMKYARRKEFEAACRNQMPAILALLDECEEALDYILQYVGHAACHGEKCRLPHCVSCFGEDAPEPNTERVWATLAKLRETREAR